MADAYGYEFLEGKFLMKEVNIAEADINTVATEIMKFASGSSKSRRFGKFPIYCH